MNTELAERVLTYVKEHPEEHDQSVWAWRNPDNSCNTTMCFAGTTVVMEYGFDSLNWGDAQVRSQANTATITENGTKQTLPISELAADALDLADWQAQQLFYESETLEDVERCLGAFKAGLSRTQFQEILDDDNDLLFEE